MSCHPEGQIWRQQQGIYSQIEWDAHEGKNLQIRFLNGHDSRISSDRLVGIGSE